MAKRIFSAYKRSLLIPTPVLSEDQMRQNIEEFNRLFDFSTAVRPGTLEILHKPGIGPSIISRKLGNNKITFCW